MRRTLVWAILLAAALAGLGRWYWTGVWARRDLYLAQCLRDQVAEFAPGWDFDFERAEWLDGAIIRLRNVRLSGPERPPLVIAPEVHVQLDPELLENGFQILVTHVVVDRPLMLIERHSSGIWNWEETPGLPDGDLPLPQITIRDGSVRLRIEATSDFPLTELQLRGIQAVFVGEAFHRYRLRGESLVDSAGALEFEGSLDVDTRAWSLAGRCAELQSPDGLLNLAASLSDKARSQLQGLARQAAVPPGDGRAPAAPVRPASLSQAPPDAPAGCVIPALGVAARVEIAFQVQQAAADAPLNYQLGVRLQDGVIDNPALPVPLRNLSGEVFVDNSQIVLSALQAATGDSRLFLDGRLSRDPALPARRFVLQARNLEFGREIHEQLWGTLRRLYDSLRPAGRFNVDLVAETDGRSDWSLHLNQFEVFDCSVLPAAFPYPAQHIRGDVRQQGDRFVLSFTGFAEDRPFTVRGELQNPGPALRGSIDIQVADLAINDTLRRALTPDSLDEMETAVNRLRLTGRADVETRLTRTGQPGDNWKLKLDARVHHAVVDFVSFPYDITDVSVHILHDALAPDPALRDVWQFVGIQGRHGPARISGSGAFAHRKHRSLLDLQLTALEVPIDRELEAACVAASPLLREAFDSLGRTGTVDLNNFRILWSPPDEPVVALPSITLRDGSLRLKYWPYTWERLTASLAWGSDRLTISQLTAWHGADTYLQIDNHGEPAAAILTFPDQGDVGWHLHLEDVQVRRIVPDAAFRAALANTGLAEVVEELDLRGPVDLRLGLDLKGARQQPDDVTAAWTLDAALLGNSLTAGLELTDINGRVRVERGLWDGRTSFIDGHFRLDSVTVLGLPVTDVEGPFLVDGNDVYVGMPAWPEAGRPPAYDPALNPRAGQQARGSIYQGKLGFDVRARLVPENPEQTVYRASITVRDALLEDFARDRGVAADRLKGPVNSRIDLLGQGSSDRNVRGSGWIQVSPAQLYELPVLNRMLASLELRQPDTTAFRYAYGQFTLHDGLIDFSEIQLLGESLLLVGRGSVAFGTGLNQQLAIEFLRSKFRNRIPVIGQAISAVTSNSIGVRVTGTLSAPVIDVQPKLGVVDDTLRKLIDGFEAGQTPGPPRMVPLAPRPAGR